MEIIIRTEVPNGEFCGSYVQGELVDNVCPHYLENLVVCGLWPHAAMEKWFDSDDGTKVQIPKLDYCKRVAMESTTHRIK